MTKYRLSFRPNYPLYCATALLCLVCLLGSCKDQDTYSITATDAADIDVSLVVNRGGEMLRSVYLRCDRAERLIGHAPFGATIDASMLYCESVDQGRSMLALKNRCDESVVIAIVDRKQQSIAVFRAEIEESKVHEYLVNKRLLSEVNSMDSCSQFGW